MEDTDRLIAKLKLAKRIEKEQESKRSEEDKIQKNKITVEEVVNSIREKSEVKIGDRLYRFNNMSFLNGELNIPILRSFFEEKRNEANVVSLINNLKGISFNAAYYKKGALNKTFEEFKEGMIARFTNSKINMEWLEEGTVEVTNSVIYYGTYKTVTGPGDMYNLVFYKSNNGSLLMGTFNCFYDDVEDWELIMKASTMLIKVK